jgi:kynurenine 3-monooxygenase
MMIALPNQDASFTVTLFLPLQGEQSFEALRDDQTCEQFMQHYYAQAIKWMPEWAVEYSQNPVGQLATLRCTPWYYQDRALLIGDAAHAIVPFHGQGMNCGFEDCAVLAETIRQNAALGWAEVFKNFADIRKPSSDAIAQMAIENYTEMRASVVDPSFQLKKALGFELQRRFPGQFTPRYSMVMFGCMPYEVALAQGQRNEVLLNSLVQGKASLAEIDWVLAAELLEQQSCQSESNEGVLVS